MNENEFKALQEQMKQVMKQHEQQVNQLDQLAKQKAEQDKELAKQKDQMIKQKAYFEAQLAEQKAEFKEDVKIIKVMIEHSDGFVDDLTQKVGELESKFTRLAEHEAATLIRLAQEFRRGMHAIVKGETSTSPSKN